MEGERVGIGMERFAVYISRYLHGSLKMTEGNGNGFKFFGCFALGQEK